MESEADYLGSFSKSNVMPVYRLQRVCDTVYFIDHFGLILRLKEHETEDQEVIQATDDNGSNSRD